MERYKYPRTYHLPTSPGKTNDDKTIESLISFFNKEIVITEKMDGENTTIYNDGYCHARSIDSKNHPSRSYVKHLAAKLYNSFPKNYRLTGENLFAKHSIFYENLEDYFYLFGVWNEDICYNWEKVILMAEKLKLKVVSVLYQGIFKEDIILELAKNLKNKEGFVIRIVDDISFQDWNKYSAKYVRANHVQTDSHWMNEKIVKNKLKKE